MIDKVFDTFESGQQHFSTYLSLITEKYNTKKYADHVVNNDIDERANVSIFLVLFAPHS